MLLTPSPAFYNGPSLKLARRWSRTAASIRCSSPIPARKPTKARSSSRANRRDTRTADAKSSPSKAVSTAAPSRPCRHRARRLRAALRAESTGFPKARLNDLDSVEAADLGQDRRRHAGADPGRSRRLAGHRRFLKALRALTKERGLLLTSTSPDRHGPNRQAVPLRIGIEPDIMTSARASAAACRWRHCSRPNHASCFEHGDQGGTFNGNPLMLRRDLG